LIDLVHEALQSLVC